MTVTGEVRVLPESLDVTYQEDSRGPEDSELTSLLHRRRELIMLFELAGRSLQFGEL